MNRRSRRSSSALAGPVRLTVFAAGLGPETNAQAVALIKEVAALDERISVAVLNPHIEREEAAAYGIDVTPAVVVEGRARLRDPVPRCSRAATSSPI